MPKVEERKVQQLRGSSYVLTLPKEWVEASGLKKGMGVTVVYEPGLLRVYPTGRRKLELSRTVETLTAEQVGELVTACYELGCSSVTISCRSGMGEDLRNVLRRLREELQGVFVSQHSEGVVSVEISEVPFKSLEQAVSILLQALVRTLRFAASGGPRAGRGELEELLRDSRGYGSALLRYVSSLFSSPESNVPHYAMPLMVEVAVRMRDLVSTVGELLTSGNWSQESLASVERLIEGLSLHVADLLSTSAQEGLMGLRREVRELRKSGTHRDVDGVLAELERLLSSLMRLNALIIAGT